MRRFKKLLSLFFVVALCVCFAIPASAEDLDVVAAYAFATELLSEYYYAKDQAADYDFTRFTDNPRFLEFLNKKTESAQYKTLLYGVDEQHDYALSFILKNTEFGDDYVIFKICSIAKFLYRNALGAYSSISAIHYVFVSENDNGYVILDWGEEGWWCYEITLRGEIWDVPEPYYWENLAISNEELSAILDKRTEGIKGSVLDLYLLNKAVAERYAANNTSPSPKVANEVRPILMVSERLRTLPYSYVGLQVFR